LKIELHTRRDGCATAAARRTFRFTRDEGCGLGDRGGGRPGRHRRLDVIVRLVGAILLERNDGPSNAPAT
jgi:hypothetical protein